jgi:protein-S-isoprenylcysteine O-methyltransferase Ste14
MKLLIPPPLQALVCAGLVYLIARHVPEFGFSFPFQSYVAMALTLAGVSIDLASVARFFQRGTTVSPVSPGKSTTLVTDGLYRFSRNPMYLGLALILTGFAVWMGNFGGFLIVPCFIWYVTRFQIVPEEEMLIEKFGLEYADYCSRVGRWL